MTTRPRHPAPADESKPRTPEDAPEPRPDGLAVSPAIGPVPALYGPRSRGQASAWTRFRRVVAGAGRLARGWAADLRQRVPWGVTMPGISADPRSSADHPWARPGDAVSAREACGGELTDTRRDLDGA
jgi:hypothetical protein